MYVYIMYVMYVCMYVCTYVCMYVVCTPKLLVLPMELFMSPFRCLQIEGGPYILRNYVDPWVWFHYNASELNSVATWLKPICRPSLLVFSVNFFST